MERRKGELFPLLAQVLEAAVKLALGLAAAWWAVSTASGQIAFQRKAI